MESTTKSFLFTTESGTAESDGRHLWPQLVLMAHICPGWQVPLQAVLDLLRMSTHGCSKQWSMACIRILPLPCRHPSLMSLCHVSSFPCPLGTSHSSSPVLIMVLMTVDAPSQDPLCGNGKCESPQEYAGGQA